MKTLFTKIENISTSYLITILFFVTFIVYSNTLFNGFVWDDTQQIVNNQVIKQVANIPNFFIQSTIYKNDSLGGPYYRPLMSTVFTVNYFFWNLNPFGFHFFDISLHAINAMLVFILFAKLFLRNKFTYSKTIGFILALIFLVHPANTESVAYVGSTSELLYTFFFLIALLLTISVGELKKRFLLKLFFISFSILFSLLSKESGIVAIPIIVLFTFLFYHSKLKIITIFSLIPLFIYLMLRFVIAQASIFGQLNSLTAKAPLLARIQTVPYELFSYLRIIFFPKDLFISQYYIVKSIDDPKFYFMVPIIIFVSSVLIFFAYRLKSKLYVFFLIWTLISMSILLNIFPLDMSVSERWLYNPLIAILGLLGVLFVTIVKKKKFSTLFLAIFILLSLVILTIRTIIRNADWYDQITLISHDISYNKTSPELQFDYGAILFDKGDLEGAKKHLEISLYLDPSWWSPYNGLAVLYRSQGNFNKAKYFETESINRIPDTISPYQNLAILKYLTENPNNTISFINNALQLYPNDPLLNDIMALASYQKNGTNPYAIFYARKAYSLMPNPLTHEILQRIIYGNRVDGLVK